MSGDDDYNVTGYDPDMVLGFGEEGAAAAGHGDLDGAVPHVLDGMEVTGDLQTDAKAELDAVSQGFRDRKAKEAERMELATNSDYWFCVCFATMDQRDAFLAATGWREHGTRFLDGRDIARRMDIDLPADPVWPNAKRDGSWDEFAMTVEDNRSIDS